MWSNYDYVEERDCDNNNADSDIDNYNNNEDDKFNVTNDDVWTVMTTEISKLYRISISVVKILHI